MFFKYLSLILGKFELLLQLVELFVSFHEHSLLALDLFDVTGKDAVMAVTLVNQTMQFFYFIIQFVASELPIVDLIRLGGGIRCRSCVACRSAEPLT